MRAGGVGKPAQLGGGRVEDVAEQVVARLAGGAPQDRMGRINRARLALVARLVASASAASGSAEGVASARVSCLAAREESAEG